ncbi:hypothetical protein [Sulfitobacter sp.]|jgi:hypothetical protein|uniref:hypothetical protein n=1 Tax=Sulfitobacter sp. TaxID=1903071 RepID=UPI003003769A
MSAPDTNIDKQEKHHRTSLWGARGAMAFGVLIMIGVVGYTFVVGSSGNDGESDGPTVSTAPTDIYAPGTNSSETPAATE